tara:strand:- start:1176 stop:1745 length:570 start_codon:yes stop_codon:yes gene_type:complete
MEGFIAFHRAALDNQLFKKPTVWHYFVYCCLRANWKNRTVPINGEEMNIERGSFITSLEKDSNATGLSIREIRTARKNLKIAKMITAKATHHYSVISVCNYERFQAVTKKSDTPKTYHRHANDKRTTTDKKRNKETKKPSLLKDRKYTHLNTFRFVLFHHCRQQGYKEPSMEMIEKLYKSGSDPKDYKP